MVPIDTSVSLLLIVYLVGVTNCNTHLQPNAEHQPDRKTRSHRFQKQSLDSNTTDRSALWKCFGIFSVCPKLICCGKALSQSVRPNMSKFFFPIEFVSRKYYLAICQSICAYVPNFGSVCGDTVTEPAAFNVPLPSSQGCLFP